MTLDRLHSALLGTCIYKHFLSLPVLSDMMHLLSAIASKNAKQSLSSYTDVFLALREQGVFSMGAYFARILRQEENLYASMLQRGENDPALESAARRELDVFLELCQTDCEKIIEAMRGLFPASYTSVLASLPRWSHTEDFSIDALLEFYRAHGAGFFANYRAFVWEQGQLIPIESPDCPAQDELLGYELQRRQVEENTALLLAGKGANHVLLFGEGGTGKSATVKSLINHPENQNLRIIEADKGDLSSIPKLVRMLEKRPEKFILFIDDLTFDQDDNTYSMLKSILEGGLSPRPKNVAVYATSNRRHLVRQTFSERAGEEIDTFETIAEKTALADRFGLRIPYQSMGKAEYLALIDHLCARKGINVPAAKLHADAMQWEIRHAGRTPRTAKQFVATLA